jgi:FkbM family methyltransferase
LRVVLDVGANVGGTSRAILERFPNTHVVAFEPVASTYSALELALGRKSTVHPRPGGSWSKRGLRPDFCGTSRRDQLFHQRR